MPVTHTVLDARTDTLVAALRAAAYLGDGLESAPLVYKGPHQVPEGPVDPAAVFVSRMGLPTLDYGMAGEPVIVTQEMAVACQTCLPADDREAMEEAVSYLAANVLRCLLANAQVAGAAGWLTGLVTGSDAVRGRTQHNTMEVEVFGFNIQFEVDLA